MKKGFTLIELLAVIALIGVLSVIGSISVTKLIKSSKEKTYQEQINNIEVSAKTWATNNTSFLSLTNDFKTYVSVEELKQAGLLENKDIIDPRNNKKMDGCVEISYSDKTKKYKYKYNNNCGEKADYPKLDIIYTANEKNYIEVTQDTTNKKDEIIDKIAVNAFDKNGNVIEVTGPIITKDGKVVEEIIPNKVGDEYSFTYITTNNSFKTTKTIKLKVVDTTPPEIYIGSTNVTGRIVNNNIIVGSEFKEPELTVEDNSGERIKAVRSGKINTQSAGEYELVYTAIDSSKNKSTYIVDVVVRLPNQLSFSLKASEVDGNNGWYKSNPHVYIENLKYGSGNDTQTVEEATCTYRINTGDTINLGTTRDFSVSTEGSNVKVTVDCSYNGATDSQVITLKIDKTAPTCTTSGGNSSWTNSNVIIKGKCSDSISGCAGTDPSYTVETPGQKTNIGPGSNGGVATVYDKAGNKGTCSANQMVKVDKTPPTCTVKAYNGVYSANAHNDEHIGWTNKSPVTVVGHCEDKESGCKEPYIAEEYKVAEGKSLNAQKYPALFLRTVSDNAGNRTSCGSTSVKIDRIKPTINKVNDVYGRAIFPVIFDNFVYDSKSATVTLDTCNNVDCYFYTTLEITDSGGSGFKEKQHTFETNGVGGDNVSTFRTWNNVTYWGKNWTYSTRIVRAIDNAGNISNEYKIYYKKGQNLTCSLKGNDMYYYYPNHSSGYPNYGVQDISKISCGK